jgi:hypothetical protein
LKRISEGDLRHIINPVTKRGEENEKESSQPEGPAFTTEQENDTDHNRRDAERVHDPSILDRVTFEEGFAQREVHDQDYLEQECPNHKQFVEFVQTARWTLTHSFEPFLLFYLGSTPQTSPSMADCGQP